MAKQKHKLEESVIKLRQVDVLTPQWQAVADTIRSVEVSEGTYHRCRQGFGDLNLIRCNA